jgi:hypothetical protein
MEVAAGCRCEGVVGCQGDLRGAALVEIVGRAGAALVVGTQPRSTALQATQRANPRDGERERGQMDPAFRIGARTVPFPAGPRMSSRSGSIRHMPDDRVDVTRRAVSRAVTT